MTNTPQIDQAAPEFTGMNQHGKTIRLEDYAGRWLVLYFYPKDNTPGCTTEAKDFTAMLKEFHALEADIVGVSPDSEKSHGKFIAKHDLKVELLSDPNHEIIESYGCWRLKKFMGKEYMGVVRSTFLIDPDGKIVQVWDKVRVKAHVEKVLAALQEKVS